MRTTIELPDELLAQAKSSAALSGISLRQFFMEAVRSRLAPEKRKVRKAPPAIGDARASRLKVLTREQIDEAMFG
jgi:Arc/MetJ family transcription regulator